MKKTLLILLLSIPSFIVAQQTTAKDAFLEKWENSKNYLLEIAEIMPDSLYNFKPTERQMSFKKQLLHIKANMDWLSTSYFTTEVYKKPKDSISISKNELIELLKNKFDAVSEIIKNTPSEELKTTVEFFAGPKSKLQILNLLQDHLTHHRGQLIVYLNLNNIKPPNYSGW
ncbi:MAG: DinB family protein [Flavobacteriaceae bacterium]|nr:DinB family protein [Flavobacteriaceae bacterium]